MNKKVEEILRSDKYEASDLSQAVLETLEQTPASQLDIFYLKKTLGRHANGIDEANKLFRSIEKNLKDLSDKLDTALTVEVVNGKTESRHIGDLIKELWENDAPRRDKKNLFNIAGRNKKKSAAAFIGFIFILLVYRNELHAAIDWIAQNFFNLIKLIF